jgi:hypothetical protein
VAAWGLILRRAEPRPAIRAGALLLLALSPFGAFLAGSSLSHTASLMWLLVAVAAWLRTLEREERSAAAAAGLAFGMAAITRPADALAFGIPAVVWLLWWWRRRRATGLVAILVLGAALPLLTMLVINAETTGSPWTSGYRLLWGPDVGLGFHPAPYGPDHTVLRGVELVSLYLLRLNRYLFEAPIPGLVPAGLALLLTGRLDGVNRYLAASGLALLAVYFGYWHDGFAWGPRFVYPMTPLIALWTARLPSALSSLGELARRTAGYGLALAAAFALAIGIPARAGQHAAAQPGTRFDPDRAAAREGISNAVVFVRETWGAQLLARLGALGADRPSAERYYRAIDACVLETALGELEARPGMSLAARLDPLLADSGSLIASPFSPDTSERFLPGSDYAPRCRARVREDSLGTALLAPTLLSRRSDLRFVRDLHERNGRLLLGEPGKAVYLLIRRPSDSIPRFLRLDRDSLVDRPR